MRPTTKALLSALFLLATTALPLAATAPRECEALRQWALDNKEKLPHDYAGLSALPVRERRAFYRGSQPRREGCLLAGSGNQLPCRASLSSRPSRSKRSWPRLRRSARRSMGSGRRATRIRSRRSRRKPTRRSASQLVREVFYLSAVDPGASGLAGDCDLPHLQRL